MAFGQLPIRLRPRQFTYALIFETLARGGAHQPTAR